MAQNDENNIYFNFSYLALKLLGKGLYSNTWAALSELIANAIDAKANEILILFDYSKDTKTIEILDNGNGMNYTDLSKKYVWIGRNKREDIDEEQSSHVMGRKGIGKLAALYLSSEYFLLTKKTKNNEECWHLNTKDSMDSEYPRLKRINSEFIDLNEKTRWNQFESGTYLKLNNVDMSHIGEKTLEALRARFANFFLLNNLNCQIKIAIKEASDYVYYPIKKNIAFKNMCGIFNNSMLNMDELIAEKLYIPTKGAIEQIKNEQYKVTRLADNNFVTKGFMEFQTDKGLIKKEYKLEGWIGIHATIEAEDAHRNDPIYLKNGTYSPNKLRLYARNKLSCENFMDYMKNTQVFGNYIEGEISFDILDDDDLQDIATSNRQGYTEDDIRIDKLKEVLKPIINNLIDVRKKYYIIIKNEMQTIIDSLEAEKSEQVEIERKAKQKAQHDVEELTQALKASEIKVKLIEEDRDKANEINDFLTKVSKLKNKDMINVVHSIYNNSCNIKKVFKNINDMYRKCTPKEKRYIQEIYDINMENIYISKSITKTGTIIDSKDDEVNITYFIYNYINRVANKIYKSKINMNLSDYKSTFSVDMKPINLSLILDNLIGNAIKANASEFTIKYNENASEFSIIIFDNGNGLDEKIIDENDIFKFGYSTTKGSGIGLFFVHQIIKKSGATLKIDSSFVNGFKIIIKWEKV